MLPFPFIPQVRRRRCSQGIFVVIFISILALEYYYLSINHRSLCAAFGLQSIYNSSVSGHQNNISSIDDLVFTVGFPEPEPDDDLSKPLAAPPKPKLCHPANCTTGTWVRRHPHMHTLADVHKVYWPSLRGGTYKMCGSEEKGRAQFTKMQEQRLVDVMNWVWKPEDGEMLEWDADKFVVRLLQSPGGVIFSGDSISRQHFNFLEYALARAGVQLTEDPPHLPQYKHKRLHQFTLKSGHPMTHYLEQKSGVPGSRVRRPIFTKMDNHILIGEKEVREITGELGAKEGFKWLDIFDYFEDWEKFVENMAAPRSGEEKTVTEDTVLILNTGAHWSRGTFYMLPKDGTAQQQQSRLARAYAEMMNRVTSRLAPIPRLTIFYRATAAAHPSCTTETSPYPDTAHAVEEEGDVMEAMGLSSPNEHQSIVRQRWDWDRFNVFNRLWEARVEELTRRKKQSGIKKSATWFFMDVWNMTLQRPDAHTQNLVDPKNGYSDCLHWCVPGVVEQWHYLLNHWLFWSPQGDVSGLE